MSQLMSSKLCPVLRPLSDRSLKITFGATNILSVRELRKQVYPRKHVEPHFERKLVLAACEPVFPADKRLPSERCFNLTKWPDREMHPLDRLLAEDMKQELRESRMICFFHENPVTNRERKATANAFQHKDMWLRYYNPDVARLAIDGTKWAPALHLCQEPKVTIAFSAEPRVARVLKLCRSNPQLVLLAAIIDDRFLSIDEIKDYNRLPDLPTLRAQLSHTLTMATRSVTDKTLYPALTLTNSIDTYISDQNK